MRPLFSVSTAGRRQLAAGFAAVMLAGLVAGCASTSDGTRTRGGIFGGRDPNRAVATVQTEYGPEFFMQTGYCPPVEIRPGTEAHTAYEGGHEGEPDFIRFQGSITKTARECHTADGLRLTVRLGVAGRVVAGPKGGAGTVTLPIRISVVKQHGGEVFYSEAVALPVTMTPPGLSADFSQVFEQVSFDITPNDQDLIVYVGFDEGEPTG